MTTRNTGKGKACMPASSPATEDSGALLFLTVEDDRLESPERGYRPLQSDVTALQQA
jgi:hypothetical protein